MSGEHEDLLRSKRPAGARALSLGIALAAVSLAAACGSDPRAPVVAAQSPSPPVTRAEKVESSTDAEMENACRQFLPSPYERVAIVRVDEDRWDDRGPNRLGIHHWKATILRSCKGDWRVSDKAAFMQYVDWSPTRGAAHPNAEAGKRLLLRTHDPATAEFEVDTGEVLPLHDPG